MAHATFEAAKPNRSHAGSSIHHKPLAYEATTIGSGKRTDARRFIAYKRRDFAVAR
jgi:hypothetical protein